jgi:hypothetical protein
MSTWATDNDGGQSDNRIAHLAAQFLGARFQGPHRDKRIARELGISPGMAKLLRAGRGWTLARLDQAVRLYGTSFSDAVLGQLRPAEKIEAQLDAISAQLHELLCVMRGTIDNQL